MRINNLIREKDFFKTLHMFELLLAGNPKFLEQKHQWMFKHWLYENKDDADLLAFYETQGITWTDIERLEQTGAFTKLLEYTALNDLKILNVRKKTQRYIRWQRLKRHREAKISYQMGFLRYRHVLLKFVVDVISGRFKL